LVSKIGEILELNPHLLEDAKRAAHMCKSDLLTQIVGELPELQGVAGRFYS
jgi:glycyl-tRNA synthetase beta chain